MKATTYNLFLDDIRDPVDAFLYTKDTQYSTKKWVIVRNYYEFVDTITEKYLEGQLPEMISFDHDLAREHYVNHTEYDEFTEKTGYECAKWLINFCIDKNVNLPEYLVHSMNPAGKSNIIHLLKNFKCEFCGGEGYHKMSCYKNK